MSLTKTSLKGAFWLGALKAGIKLFSFVKIIIVARILNPQDFGLFGMICIPYGLIEVATEPGLNQALIQTPNKPEKYFTSTQIIFLLRGLLIYFILFFSAPFISSFYNTDLTQAVRVIALAPLARGFINPAIVLLRKNLKFSTEFTWQLLTSITESLATIVFSLKLRTMLALPLGVVAGAVAATFFSYLFSRFQLTTVSFSQIKKLYRYGRWVTLGGLLSYLNDQTDDFFVSKLLGAQPLGLYQTAYKISNLPTTQGAGLIYQVVFPIFSSIQDHFIRLKRGIIKSLLATFTLSLLLGLGIYWLTPIFTPFILGSQWLPMIPALNVLIIFGITRPLISVGAAYFDATGQPGVTASLNSIKLIVLLLGLYPLTKNFGIVGTAWSVVIAQLAVYPWFSFKLISSFKKIS